MKTKLFEKVKIKSEIGVTLLEYSLLALLAIMVCVGGMALLGEETSSMFSSVEEGFDN